MHRNKKQATAVAHALHSDSLHNTDHFVSCNTKAICRREPLDTLRDHSASGEFQSEIESCVSRKLDTSPSELCTRDATIKVTRRSTRSLTNQGSCSGTDSMGDASWDIEDGIPRTIHVPIRVAPLTLARGRIGALVVGQILHRWLSFRQREPSRIDEDHVEYYQQTLVTL
jgi:hypothetical protein